MKKVGDMKLYSFEELLEEDYGKVETLGLVSEKSEENYVQLPASTQWAEGKFTEADYNELVAKLFKGEIKVSADTENAPTVEIAVDYQGNIK